MRGGEALGGSLRAWTGREGRARPPRGAGGARAEKRSCGRLVRAGDGKTGLVYVFFFTGRYFAKIRASTCGASSGIKRLLGSGDRGGREQGWLASIFLIAIGWPTDVEQGGPPGDVARASNLAGGTTRRRVLVAEFFLGIG